MVLWSVVCCLLAALAAGGPVVIPPDTPNVWGGPAQAPDAGMMKACSGHLFAFSGLDGQTVEAVNFVSVFSQKAFSLHVCLKERRDLTIDLPADQHTVHAATGDVLVASPLPQTAADPALVMVWKAWDLLQGTAPAGTRLALAPSVAAHATTAAAAPTCSSSVGKSDAVVLCLADASDGTVQFAMAYGPNGTAALARATAGVAQATAVNATATERLQQYGPSCGMGAFSRLYNKAVSIMRVNALSPEGQILQRWSTPDRVPHQWMWLWDSCYHSMAMNELTLTSGEPGHVPAWEYVKSVIDAAGPDGGIAIQRTPYDTKTTVLETQPPLLSWAIWDNYQAALSSGAGDAGKARLAYAFPRLVRFLEWDIRSRGNLSTPGTGPLFYWKKGTESGMDNSQRFDDGILRLAVDFSVFFAREAQHVSQMAAVLGNTTEAARWAGVAANVTKAVHAQLWDDKSQFYLDRNPHPGPIHGTFSTVHAVTGLLPLWLDGLAADRKAALLAAIANSDLFNTTLPLPSVSASTRGFSTDMWRGPMWLNTNYHVVLALITQGEVALARTLMEKTLAAVSKYYDLYGVIFEFYDAHDHLDPRVLLRKGFHTGGVRDYHWSAALTVKMLKLLNQTR